MQNFISFWQNLPQNLDPVAISIAEFDIRWYGLMYIAAFACTYLLVNYRTKHEKSFEKYSQENNKDFILDLFTWMIIGLLLGARVGYILFYNFSYFIQNPLEAFLPLQISSSGFEFTGISGMSYHGGVLGVLLAGWIFLKIKKESFWKLADLVCPAIPLGYTFGRIGNFLNGELWGRTTDSDIGMYFPRSPDYFGQIASRHPSQLYEAFFEGIILFIILWNIRKWASKKTPAGSMLAAYILGYGIFRFFIEYFREPDDHLGFVFLEFSMGQILSFGMVAGAVVLFIFLSYNAKRKKVK